MNPFVSITNWGVTQSTSPELATKIRLSNLLSIAIIIAHVSYAGFLLSYGLLGQTFISAIIVIVISTVLLYLNKLKYYDVSRIGVIFLLSLSAFLFVNALGRKSGVQYLFFPIVAAPYLIFLQHEKYKKIGGVLIPLTLFCIISFQQFSFFSELDITEETKQLIGALVAITAFTILVFVQYSFHTQIGRNEQRLIAKNKELLKSKTYLENQEAKFRSLIENAFEGILLYDEDGEITYSSPANEKILGFKPHEIIGKLRYDIIYIEDQKIAQKEFDNILKDPGKTIHFEVRVIHKNGEYIWVEAYISNMLHVPDIQAIVSNFRDITERKKNEEQIERLIDRTKLILETTTNGYLLFNLDAKIIDTNPAFSKIIGYSVKELKSMSVTDIENESTDIKIAQVIENTAITGHKRFETHYKTKQGKIIVVEVSAATMLLDNEHYIVAFIEDITPEKEALTKLAESEKRYRTLADNFPNGTIFTVDKEYRFTFVAGTDTKRIATNTKNIISKKISDIFSEKNAKKTIANLKLVFEGKSRSFELTFKDDTHFFLSAIPIKDELGEINEIIVVSQNITVRKQAEEALYSSEQKFRKVFTQSQIAIALTDIKTPKHSDFNNAYMEMLGYPKKELMKLDLKKVTHSKDIIVEQKLYNDIIKGKRKSYQLEKRFISKDGESIWALSSVTVLTGHDGNPEYILSMIKDITEKKLADEKVKELNEQLEENVIERTHQLTQANIELEAFNYTVSHDLRMPLRAASIFSGLLKYKHEDILDKEAKEYIDSIDKCIHEMAQLIKDIMEFSKVGREKLDIEKVNMERLTKEVVRELADYSKGNKTKYNLHDINPIKADKGMIKQVLTNLMANSIKYSSNKEKPNIEVSSYEENGEIVYFVKDNGVGFDMRYVDKVFKVFERLHGADEFDGTGVGLAIVKRIINKHGGRVWAEAEVNKGACVYFTLPTEPANQSN